MRISDWSSDVCSSDLSHSFVVSCEKRVASHQPADRRLEPFRRMMFSPNAGFKRQSLGRDKYQPRQPGRGYAAVEAGVHSAPELAAAIIRLTSTRRSEEHTSELQSLMRTSYAVFCLKKKKKTTTTT